MSGDVVATDLHHVVERRSEPDRLDDRRRAGLEFVRRLAVGDAIDGDLLDHAAAALIGAHGVEMRPLGVQHADAGGAVRLVAGEYVEIGVQLAHVDAEVHGRLAAVDEHGNAALVRQADDLADRHQRAEHVRHVGDGDELGARGQQPLELLQQQLAVVGDRRPLQDRAVALAMEVPRHDVGVMLHDRQDDLVALADAGEK